MTVKMMNFLCKKKSRQNGHALFCTPMKIRHTEYIPKKAKRKNIKKERKNAKFSN